MPADTTSIKVDTFGDVISIVENRARIAGTVQDADKNFIKGAINEFYIKICTERNWTWRKFDRDFIFGLAITTGTASVTFGSREVVFTGLTLDATHRGRSFQVTGTSELYRIIGINTANNSALLSSSYAGTTNALATYKMYQYEFPLPPDCDTITQVYIDNSYSAFGGSAGELEEMNVLEFNRILSTNPNWRGTPAYYNRDGMINTETLPPLDVQVLDYDFLGGEADEDVSRLRIFPIEPDTTRLIHLNYSIQVEPLMELDQKPIMPVDDRWILIHHALGVWHASNNSGTLADREFAIATKMLKEMRAEHHKTDIKPKVIIRKDRYQREHFRNRDDEIFRISRRAEY